MKLSYNWLKDYLKINLTPEELAQVLTSIGLEVGSIETFETIKGGLKGIVLGEVLTCERHPNADKLSLTTVNIGSGEPLKIVCGAPNVAAGQKVVVATIGTTLYKGDESFMIKESKIRGELSQGMICAEDEIGLGHSHAGIMVLPADVQVGLPASKYFNVSSDFVLEVDITPNRIEAASHFGTARELAAYFKQNANGIELEKPVVEPFTIDNNNYKITVQVDDNAACPRYSGITVSNVQVKESPEWLKNKLLAIGLNPINNIVDITNFVLHESGQPLHAFDADKIKGKKVIVKCLPDGSKFTTLDGVERALLNNDLIICNEVEGMCIAGVYGGLHSGVTTETQNVFIESAHFNPVSVRKTSKRMMLSTDSSFRFERGTDPENTLFALKRAALLMKELAGGTISSEIVDVYPSPVEPAKISITYDYVNQLIGKDIDAQTVKNILNYLQIKVIEENTNGLTAEVPLYKVDVKNQADLVEEILRIYGYNNVEIPQTVHSTLAYYQQPNKEKLVGLVADMLAANGFNEAMCNSLTKSQSYEGLDTFKPENLVMIKNPLSAELNCMRQSLLIGALESVSRNLNHRVNNVKIFEFGNTYSFNAEAQGNPLKKYTEVYRLALTISGNKKSESWLQKEEPADFYFLKSNALMVLKRLGLQVAEYSEIGKLVQGSYADIFEEGLSCFINKKEVVCLGQVAKSLLKKFDIDVPVYFADFNWDAIMQVVKQDHVKYTELPKFPEVRRDLALLVDKAVNFEKFNQLAFKYAKGILKNVNLFDVYEGKNLPEGKKSYAISFILQDENKTLTDKQIDGVMQNLIQVFDKELGAKLR